MSETEVPQVDPVVEPPAAPAEEGPVIHPKAAPIESRFLYVDVAALRGTEFERAREVWRKKFDAPPKDAAERAKQARFLAARGFSGEVISRVLRLDE